MSVIDILFRVDDICKKYDKYDVDKQHALNASSNDPFLRIYNSFEEQIEAAQRRSDIAAGETNRAKVVAINAEIRRLKVRLMEEIPKLQKLAAKKAKGVSKEEQEARQDLVITLPDKIRAIPDGSTNNTNQTGGWEASGSNTNIRFDNSDGQFGDEFFQQTEESNQYRREYEMRRMNQDQGLDVISDGLDTLKNLARDMNEELDRQVPLADEIDTKANKASTDLRSTNVKLKATLHQYRSSQNFCIDIILLCVLLGVATYLYNALSH